MRNTKRHIVFAGDRYGRLTIVQEMPKKKTKRQFECYCDCGNTKTVSLELLRNGKAKSCGCKYIEYHISRRATPVMKERKRLLNVWHHMIDRCYKPSAPEYSNYGGRGIEVCDEWRKNFTSFYEWCIASGASRNLTIDRIDNNKGYSPDNCRFATRKEQALNKRSNVMVSINGETKTIKEWSDIVGVGYDTMWYRIRKYGFSGDKILTPYNLSKKQPA